MIGLLSELSSAMRGSCMCCVGRTSLICQHQYVTVIKDCRERSIFKLSRTTKNRLEVLGRACTALVLLCQNLH